MLRLFAFVIIGMTLISCQKDVTPVPTNPVTKDLLLVKAVTKFKTDSFSYSFQYNASKKLIGEDYIQSWQGVKDTAQTSIDRNGQNIIQKLTYKSGQLRKQGFTSFSYNVLYDATQSRYFAKVSYYTLRDSSYMDSVVYTYNGAQQIVREEKFSTSGSTTGGYAPAGKKEYAYDDKGNIIQRSEYSNKNAAKEYKLTITYKYVYDANAAPLKLGAEGIVIGDIQFTPENNPVKTSYIDNTKASNNYNSTTVYILNADNWPSTATVNYEGGDTSLVTTYFYEGY